MSVVKVVIKTAGLVAILIEAVLAQECSRYGGGSCCSDVNPVDKDFRDEDYNEQPLHYKFIPDNEHNRNIDNNCVTFFPLPDDPETFIAYHSETYCDGSNSIFTYILSQPEPGVRRLGKALCSYSETIFAEADHTNVDPACSVDLLYRCLLRGDCSEDSTRNSSAPVYGLSSIRRPISRSCLNSIKTTIRNNGLPDQDYYILPQRLPSRCVFNQVCTILPVLQRFRQVVGVAFPTLEYI